MDFFTNPEFWYAVAPIAAYLVYCLSPGPQGKIVGKLLVMMGDRMKEQAKPTGKKKRAR